MTSAAMQLGGENSNDLQHIARQLLFETAVGALVDDDNFDTPGLAQGEYELRTETQETVLMGQNKTTELAFEDVIEKMF